MTNRDRIKIKKKKEMRTKDISQMISEGGLGSDNYYNIIKKTSSNKETNSQENANEIDEKNGRK